MSALRRILGLDNSQTADSPPSASTDPRQRLRDAHAAKATAEQALQEAEAATARVRDVIAGAEPAEEAAKQAAAAAAASTKAWAISGATGPSGDEDALDAAADAERAAIAARIRADGALAAMPEVRQLEEDARIGVRQADEQIQGAIRDVMLQELEPHFQTLEAAQAAGMQANIEIHSLAAALFGRWHPFSHHALSQELIRRLKATALPDPGDAEIAEHRIEWVNFAERLLADPDASK